MTGTPLADRNTVDVGYPGRFRAVGVVLQARGKGPELCLGSIASSLPPGCSGPAIVGWSWDRLPHSDQAGSRWGSYVVLGRYDGTRFTLTQPATAATAADSPRVGMDVPDLTTPCPPPPRGWTPPDPARATNDTFQAATELARRQAGFGTLWIDQRLDPAATPPDPSGPPNDSKRFVLNVTTTGDIATMQRMVRTVWGGSLCVSPAIRTAGELETTMKALLSTPGLLAASPDDRSGQVVLTLVRATTQLRRDLDARFGAGTVRLLGALAPLD